MGASNFGCTNLPSDIIYAFAMQQQADEEFDLLLKDEAGEGMTEDDRDMQTEMIVRDNYRETIDYVKEALALNTYEDEWKDGTTKIIGYVNVTLFNKESKEWECGRINILVEYGYHEGARLDIDLDCLYDNFPPLNKSQQKLVDREIRRIEKVFAEVCPIRLKKLLATSDGMSMYVKV